MKVLWVTNKVIGKMADELNLPKDGYGGWMDQTLDEIKKDESISLVFLTSGSVRNTKKTVDGREVYYLIPGGSAYSGFKATHKNLQNISEIINAEKPDLIHLWGTESALGFATAMVSKSIPKVVFIQGFVHSIQQNYYKSTSKKELKSAITFYDILKRKTIRNTEKSIRIKTENEKKVLELSDAVICDSFWCEAVCKAINAKLKVYKKLLPIDAVFRNSAWHGGKGHTLFCSSQYAPFKGFETLLRALKIVKNKYPDVTLNVPGGWDAPPKTLRGKRVYNSYSKHINKLIADLGLKDNVKNLGSLSRKQMSDYMSESDVFVQASTVENHSSTMREAMFVGMPCIVSSVGATPEYVENGVSGLLFRSG